NVGVRLQLDLARGTASGKTENAVDETGSSFQIQLLGHNPQSAVGRDEVHGRDALVAADGKQQVPQKDRPAGPGGRDGQVLRRIGQIGSREASSPEFWSIGMPRRRSQDEGARTQEPATRS